MSDRAIPGGLELDCPFAEGSRAQSCILTVCRLENGMEEYCMILTIVRESHQQSGQLTGLQPGLYIVKNVTEVESDGSVTLLRRTVVLQLTITEPPPTILPTKTISSSLFIVIDDYAYYELDCLCYVDSPSIYRWSVQLFCTSCRSYHWRYKKIYRSQYSIRINNS